MDAVTGEGCICDSSERLGDESQRVAIRSSQTTCPVQFSRSETLTWAAMRTQSMRGPARCPLDKMGLLANPSTPCTTAGSGVSNTRNRSHGQYHPEGFFAGPRPLPVATLLAGALKRS
jgi:hypothetical protein